MVSYQKVPYHMFLELVVALEVKLLNQRIPEFDEKEGEKKGFVKLFSSKLYPAWLKHFWSVTTFCSLDC
jgi:hypothetical protein